jgi:hypothetical protein
MFVPGMQRRASWRVTLRIAFPILLSGCILPSVDSTRDTVGSAPSADQSEPVQPQTEPATKVDAGAGSVPTTQSERVVRVDAGNVDAAINGVLASERCSPGEYRCTSKLLSTCKPDGTGFSPVKECQDAQCNATLADCTRECLPGAQFCDGDVTFRCDTSGHYADRMPCAVLKPHCVGNGRCVECVADADCPDPGMCKTKHCDLTGACAPQPAVARTKCGAFSEFLCNGRGACSFCVIDSDCPVREGGCYLPSRCMANGYCTAEYAAKGATCLDGICDGVGNCGECNEDAECRGKVQTGECRKALCSAGKCTTALTDCPAGKVCQTSGVCS